MNQKTLAKAAGFVGLIGGILTLILRIIKTVIDIGAFSAASFDSDAAGSFFATALIFTIFILMIRIAILVFGILGVVKFSKDPRVSVAAPILLIVAFGINIFPLLGGFAADILSIIGGILFLVALPKLDQPFIPQNPYPYNGFPNQQSYYQNQGNPTTHFQQEPVWMGTYHQDQGLPAQSNTSVQTNAQNAGSQMTQAFSDPQVSAQTQASLQAQSSNSQKSFATAESYQTPMSTEVPASSYSSEA